MWSSGALSTALSSLMANQLALSVASNNIANAGDPNYTRRRLLTAPAGSDGGALGRSSPDADLAKAISELTMSQQQLQATLAVGARASQLTILDYLK